jgi:hypothetical protein
VFVKLQKFLTPCGVVHFYLDAAGAYDRHRLATAHTVAKRPRNRLNANLPRDGRGSSAWHANQFVALHLCSCMTP